MQNTNDFLNSENTKRLKAQASSSKHGGTRTRPALIDEIHDRIDYERQTVRKKRLVKNDFVKIPPPTEEEKKEKKKRMAQKMIILEENKKRGITRDLEKRLKKVKESYFDSLS